MEKYHVKVNMDDDFASMNGAFALVKVNGKSIKRIAASANGKIEFDLEFGQDYVVEFHKQFYATKKIDVFLRQVTPEMIDIGCRGNTWHVGMIQKVEGIDYSVLDKPVGKIFYEPDEKCFGWDADYSLRVMEQLEKLEEEMEAKKREYEKSLADADKSISKKEFDAAKGSVARAKELFPNDKKTEDIQNKLDKAMAAAKDEETAAAAAAEQAKKEEEEKRKKEEFDNHMDAGDKALKAGTLDQAIKHYQDAGTVDPSSTAVKTKIQVVEDTKAKRAAEEEAKKKEEEEKKRLEEEEAKKAAAAAATALAAKEADQKAKEEAAAAEQKAKEEAEAAEKLAKEEEAKKTAEAKEAEAKEKEASAAAALAAKKLADEEKAKEKEAAELASKNEKEAKEAAKEQEKEDKQKQEEEEAKKTAEASAAAKLAKEEEQKAKASAAEAEKKAKEEAKQKEEEQKAKAALAAAPKKTEPKKEEPKKEEVKEKPKEDPKPKEKKEEPKKKPVEKKKEPVKPKVEVKSPTVAAVSVKHQNEKKKAAMHGSAKKTSKSEDKQADIHAKLDQAAMKQNPKSTSIGEHHDWDMHEPGVSKAIAQEYPEGVTEEIYMKGNKEITERVVVKDGRGDIYWKVKHPWGGIYYFKNNTINISAVEFDLFTVLKDEDGNIIEPYHIDRVQDHDH
tara:strand:- start:519 stop:2540 length:2022 start_codon:yes stop_codon:yes gene_type:complete